MPTNPTPEPSQGTFYEIGICRLFTFRKRPRRYALCPASNEPATRHARVRCIACGRVLTATHYGRVPNHVRVPQ